MEPAILTPHLFDREATPRAAVERWGGDAETLEHVKDGAAFVYRFELGGALHYLRLTTPGWRSHEELEAEIAFVAAAREHGVLTPPFVPSRRGALVEELPSRQGVVYASVVEAAPGVPVTRETMNADLMYAQGVLIGRLHRASDTLVLPPGSRRDDWRQELAIVREWLPESEVAAHRALDEETAFVATLPEERGAYGIVHFDASGSNLLVDGDDLWLIDFDDAVVHWHVVDLASSAWFVRSEGRSPAPRPRARDGWGLPQRAHA